MTGMEPGSNFPDHDARHAAFHDLQAQIHHILANTESLSSRLHLRQAFDHMKAGTDPTGSKVAMHLTHAAAFSAHAPMRQKWGQMHMAMGKTHADKARFSGSKMSAGTMNMLSKIRQHLTAARSLGDGSSLGPGLLGGMTEPLNQ